MPGHSPFDHLKSHLQNARSNLESFLEHTTPSVPCHQLPCSKVSASGGVDCSWKYDSEKQSHGTPAFNLGDLWGSFEEWSAYGAGVPLILPSGETTVQYYVPYLSALQLFLSPACKERLSSDDSDWSDASESRESDSGFSSDNETDKVLQPNTNGSMVLREAGNETQGQLVFEYFERCSPFGRSPLREKVSELSRDCQILMSLNSNELSSTSWFSVAWYPIYRIPIGPTMRDLSACFLTFHSLSTLQEFVPSVLNMRKQLNNLQMEDNYANIGIWTRSPWRMRSREMVLELPPFGLASYKLRGPFWEATTHDEEARVSSLARCADLWLRHLRVQHPDFNFFTSRHCA